MMHPYWLLIVAGVFAIVPVILGVASSYLKISIVLGVLKNALGTQTFPNQLIVMALSICLSFFVMHPVIEQSVKLAPSEDFVKLQKLPSAKEFSNYAVMLTPWISFLEKHAGAKEIEVFRNLATKSEGSTSVNNGLHILLPAFMVSELKEACLMAFFVLLPFLVIDLIVSNILVGLGMFMLSPVLVSLPLKLLLFVVADGWILLLKSLVNSYQ
jgi:type III secretory pathway component EscR